MLCSASASCASPAIRTNNFARSGYLDEVTMLHTRPPSPSELSVAPPASRRLRPLPLVVEPSASSSADLGTAIGANGAELDRLLRVHGALLFRNWRVPDTASFAAAARKTPVSPVQARTPRSSNSPYSASA